METWANILEHELEGAFEVKNHESLKRSIQILAENFVRKDPLQEMMERNEREHLKISTDIRIISERMEQGFKRMDERFERMDERFKQVDERFKQMDERFKQVDERFEMMGKRIEQVDKRIDQVDKRIDQVDKRIGLVDKRFNRNSFFLVFGFTVITVLITIYRFLV